MSWRKSINSRWIFPTSMGGCWDISECSVFRCEVPYWYVIGKRNKLNCFHKTVPLKMVKMFPHVLATAACAPGGGWGRCLFAGHSDQSCLAPYYPSSAAQMAPCQQPWLADPRQDDSKILLIFWFLKFAPFTSNHCQYRCVSRCLFSFTPRCTQLIPHCASTHFFHWATELLRSALRIRSSTLGCLVFFWPWILLRWGQQWTEYLAIPDIVELSIAGWLKHTEPMHLRGIWPSKSFHPRFLNSRICTGAAVVFPWSAGSIQALGSRAEAMVGWLSMRFHGIPGQVCTWSSCQRLVMGKQFSPGLGGK